MTPSERLSAVPRLRSTREYVVSGELTAARYAAVLIEHSRWFEFTPLPDDEYLFVVKREYGVPEPPQ